MLWDKGAPTGLSVGDWWVISIVLVVLVIIRNTLVRHSMRFTVTNLRIVVRRGILARVEQTTAIARIQNITTRQTVVQRMLGVGDVEFDTAGGDLAAADLRFVGIADPHDVVRRIDYDVRESTATTGRQASRDPRQAAAPSTGDARPAASLAESPVSSIPLTVAQARTVGPSRGALRPFAPESHPRMMETKGAT